MQSYMIFVNNLFLPLSESRGLSRDNWSGVKSGPPGPIFACEMWTALAKSGPGLQKPANSNCLCQCEYCMPDLELKQRGW